MKPLLPQHYFTLSFLCCTLSVPFAIYGISSRLFRLPFHIFRKVSPPCLAGTAPSLLLPTWSLYCSPDTFGLTCMPLCVALALCGNPSFPKSFYTSSKAYLSPMKCPATLPTNSYQALALLNIPPHKQPTLTLSCPHTVGHHSPFYTSVC